MTGVFGAVYASAYDALYQDKDYDSECDQIERAFHAYGHSITSVLDLGCGTGSHAIPLAQRGYNVVGVDRSAEMLARAREKANSLALGDTLSLHRCDIHQLDLQLQFDAVMMMFAVLGYQLQNTDVISALSTARRHLRREGLFVFDVWYGPAVLHQRPSPRIKIIPTDGGQILRVVSGALDIRQHLCAVDYRMWQLEDDRLVANTEEKHSMRYFFPLELELLLQSSGFRLLRLGAFPDFDEEPTEAAWNVLGIAGAE